MSKYIDADSYVEMQIYDDEHEEWSTWNGTIEELLDQWTEEGCPPTIEVSEDCISRKRLFDKAECGFDKLGEDYDINYMLRDIKNAPSVLPKRSCYRCGLREDC